MLRLLFAALAALTLLGGQTQAQSQLLLGAGGSKRAVAAYVGPGDIVSGATTWGGLRCYNAAKASASQAIRIRRASDSTEQDIGLTAACALDTASADTFCAATTCFVTTAYDQTGNSRNFVQATAAKQPQLLTSGGPSAGLPYMACVRASAQELVATTPDTAQPHSWMVIANRTGSTTLVNGALRASNNGLNISFQTTEVVGIRSSAGLIGGAVAAASSSWHVLQALWSGASSHVYSDGTAGSNGSESSTTGTSLALCQGSAGNNLDGRIAEGGIWPADISASAGALNSNAHTYWGF